MISKKVILLFAFAAVVVFAQESSPKNSGSVLAATRSHYNSAATFETVFDLSIYWSIREKEEKKKGHIYFGADDKFSVEIGKEKFVSDGTTYWHYDGRTGQVTIKNSGQIDKAQLPSRVIDTYLNDYELKKKSSESGVTLYEWDAASSPKKSSNSYQLINVWIDTAKHTIKKVRVVDSSENIQTYAFQKTVFNAKIPTEVFTFEIPKTARVVDLRP